MKKAAVIFLSFSAAISMYAQTGDNLHYYRTPFDYGASCTDVTINAAIRDTTFKGAHDLFIPPGTCTLSNPITWSTGGQVRLFGVPGESIIQATSSIGTMVQAINQNIVIEDITFDANQNVTTAAIDIESPNTPGSFSLRNIVIKNCTSTNCALADGVKIYNSGGTLRDSDISGFGQQVYVDSASSVSISNNHLHDNATPAGGQTGGNAVFVGHSSPADSPTVVSGNVIENVNSSTTKGGATAGQDGNGVVVYQAHGVLVEANRINNPSYSCLRSNSSWSVVFSGNRCSNAGETAAYSEFSARNNVWTGNYFETAWGVCLSLTNAEYGGYGHIAVGNRFVNCGTAHLSNQFAAAIDVESLGTVVGNTIDESYVGISAGANISTATGTLVVANNVVNLANTAIDLPGGNASNILVQGNVIANSTNQFSAIPAGVQLVAQTLPFATLSGAAASDGSFVYCPDCKVQSTCAGGGAGSFAKRIAGQWSCQ